MEQSVYICSFTMQVAYQKLLYSGGWLAKTTFCKSGVFVLDSEHI